ncbi:MAG: 2-oxoacid:acceptor oxidoreductase family protein [Bacillota bacterium]
MGKAWQVVLAGAGGQGLVLGGVLLGEAASLHAGKNALQTQSYGIASRGGFSCSEVVISDQEIVYPGVLEPDVALVLTGEALEMYKDAGGEDTILIVDEAVENPGLVGMRFPLEKTARQLGSQAVQNLVGLGVILGLTGMIPPEAMSGAIKERFQGRPGLELNIKAFETGLALAREGKKS